MGLRRRNHRNQHRQGSKVYRNVPQIDSQGAKMGDETKTGKPAIMLVDDNPMIFRGFIKLFEKKYHVVGVTSGYEALERINDLTHCVVMDVKMAGMDGFETYKRLEQVNPKTPIIFHTAFQSEHNLIEVLNTYQPYGYVEKGQDPSILVALVDEAVEYHHLHLENIRIGKELEEANSALRVILRNIEKDKQEWQKDISNNLSTLVIPYLEKLDIYITEAKGKHIYELIKENLSKITHPLAKSEIFYNLTPSEIQIAKLIVDRVPTIEIADQLSVTEKAVQYHRGNMRKKLGLRNKQIDLRTILAEILPN